ncbi:probable cyclin-dependent serine/threonine-protein kinase DDB_G0292550 [Bicyclus anynana]|uniref:Probable cyclin-dependent serine/threonine-protein kinase DDB_G0292550 n=1 Tax=Bicyclus anynana TaxID=110368 RepID=A0A6J1P7Q8_BICAN|nr:probable cyclin-dependent serine/threonine-protein kinase DDB_G0292550 [Bicyclus anynana]
MSKSEQTFVSSGYIDIGLAERMINKYDGDKSNLHVFIDNCNNAYQLLNPIYNVAFVSVVLSKIEGNIRSTLLNRSFPSWENLKTHLLENYSEKRTFAQWQLELNSCKQGNNETVLRYSNRVENCYIKLIKSLDPKLTKEARQANVELLKNQALNIFISGLLPQLHILLKSQKPTTLEDAISIAISEEQEIKSRQEMSLKHTYNPLIKRCSICNKLGHFSHQCRSQPQIRQMQSNHSNNNIPTCFVCKKRGHLARDCWNNPKVSRNNYSNNPQNNTSNRSNNRNYGNNRQNYGNNRFNENFRNNNNHLNSKGLRPVADPKTEN